MAVKKDKRPAVRYLLSADAKLRKLSMKKLAEDGTKGTATVTQTDGKGTISVAAPFLHKDEAEQSIQTDLRKRAPRATVVCPDIIVVNKADHPLTDTMVREIKGVLSLGPQEGCGALDGAGVAVPDDVDLEERAVGQAADPAHQIAHRGHPPDRQPVVPVDRAGPERRRRADAPPHGGSRCRHRRHLAGGPCPAPVSHAGQDRPHVRWHGVAGGEASASTRPVRRTRSGHRRWPAR